MSCPGGGALEVSCGSKLASKRVGFRSWSQAWSAASSFTVQGAPALSAREAPAASCSAVKAGTNFWPVVLSWLPPCP